MNPRNTELAMLRKNSKPVHPGLYVRNTILKPRKITVTKAAELLKFSRPNVSNFLNGKISASPDMAARLESTFGISAKEILDLQTKYDAAAGEALESAQEALTYVPHFLNFVANDISAWSEKSEARSQFAVMLRTLIHSTGRNLLQVDFPGNESKRPCWDGFMETTASTPWIPSGLSGWMFGVNTNVKRKADTDFDKCVAAFKSIAEKQNITFVFVTSQHWPDKNEWVSKAKSLGIWKDVRAYDASDLGQWIAQSPAAQAWFADQTKKPSEGVRTLGQCWKDWAEVAEPKLEPCLFSDAVASWSPKLLKYLERKEKRPFTLVADSADEALAFLSRALSSPEALQYRDRTIIFDKPGLLSKLAAGNADFIAVTHTQAVERELTPYVRSFQSIIIRPRNAPGGKPDIELEPLGCSRFRRVLQQMIDSPDEVKKLAGMSGGSLTVLRRRLATVQTVKVPAWASTKEQASALIPFALMGVWDTESNADKAILSTLTNEPYSEVAKRLKLFETSNESPIWSVGRLQGVVSQTDVLFAVAHAATHKNIERFFKAAGTVLIETDPSLEPIRWGMRVVPDTKEPKYSRVLRKCFARSLACLSVYEKDLFPGQTDFEIQTKARDLVQNILSPLTAWKLENHQQELELYASAAPNLFLDLLEQDVSKQNPGAVKLLRTTAPEPFGICPRLGLLSALRTLAENPDHFPRVVRILGALAEIEIKDSWFETPLTTLAAVFNACLPSSEDLRVKSLNKLAEEHPKVAWRVCIEELRERVARVYAGRHQNLEESEEGGASDISEPIPTFSRMAADFVLTRSAYAAEGLCELVSVMLAFTTDEQQRAWKIFEDWTSTNASSESAAEIRETVRETLLPKAHRLGFEAAAQQAEDFCKKHIPSDPVSEYEWLFRNEWLETTPNGVSDDDFKPLRQHIEQLRIEALKKIWTDQGSHGIFALADKGNCQRVIGRYLATDVLAANEIGSLLLKCLRIRENRPFYAGIAKGILSSVNEKERANLCRTLRKDLNFVDTYRLMSSYPYCRHTWKLLDRMLASVRSLYWQNVEPKYIFNSIEENNESVSRLLEANRPKAAFTTVGFNISAIRPDLVARMLQGMMDKACDKYGTYVINSAEVKQAFDVLRRSAVLSPDEMARLEFEYLDVLVRAAPVGEEGPIPNLELYLESHPELFAQAVMAAYQANGKSDGKKDLSALRGQLLLETIKRIPGQDELTETKQRRVLAHWINAVRSCCKDPYNLRNADVCLGKFLSNAPTGKDGIWPTEAVREVMENMRSQAVSYGATLGLASARGAFVGAAGGDEERTSATKYRGWAKELYFTHPFVATTILEAMADNHQSEPSSEECQAGPTRRLSARD